MLSVLIADDHAIVRRGLIELLRDLYGDVDAQEADTGDDVIERVAARAWDLVMLDIMMPGPPIEQLLRQIRADAPKVPILVLTAANEASHVIVCMRAGANGFVHKHLANGELQEAVRRVAAGGTYLHPDAAVAVARSLQEPVPASPHDALSERELAVMIAVARGRALKEVAFDMGLSPKTVATYLSRIREKTGLSGPAEMARYALQHRLMD